MVKKKTQFTENLITNQKTYEDFYSLLKNLALNVFKWENLPDSVDERFLELTLFEKGYCLFFEDEVMGILGLTCTIGMPLNVYRIPTERRAFATNGYIKMCTDKDSILVYNNYLRIPTEQMVQLYAKRLYEIQRSIDTNIKAQKTPVMILSPEQQRLSMLNLYKEYDGNSPIIFASDQMDLNGFQVLKTDAPFVADKLHVAMNSCLNDALSRLGIENSNSDKKERLVSAEVNSNTGLLEAQRNVMLNSRRQACEQYNKMFGGNISVKFRSELQSMLNSSNLDEELFAEDDLNE